MAGPQTSYVRPLSLQHLEPSTGIVLSQEPDRTVAAQATAFRPAVPEADLGSADTDDDIEIDPHSLRSRQLTDPIPCRHAHNDGPPTVGIPKGQDSAIAITAALGAVEMLPQRCAENSGEGTHGPPSGRWHGFAGQTVVQADPKVGKRTSEMAGMGGGSGRRDAGVKLSVINAYFGT